RGSESTRRRRLGRPLHDHSATPPGAANQSVDALVHKRKGRAAAMGCSALPKDWSGKGVSNSRPQPWQGCALPTELFPHWAAHNYSGNPVTVKTTAAKKRPDCRCYTSTVAIASAT